MGLGLEKRAVGTALEAPFPFPQQTVKASTTSIVVLAEAERLWMDEWWLPVSWHYRSFH